MHVACSFFAAFTLARRSRWHFAAWLAWATAVAASTLTAKQHSAVDVVAGFTLALAAWVVFSWLPLVAPRRSVGGSVARLVPHGARR